MDKIGVAYDKKNAINLILGSLWSAIAGWLTLLGNMARQNLHIQTMYVIILVILIGSYAGFIGIRWYYYNSRFVGHLPMLSQREIRDIVSKEVEKLVE